MLSLFAFLLVVATVFAVLGLQLLGRQPAGSSRPSFHAFPAAWLSIFQVTSGDQWMDIMWQGMRMHWARLHLA